jgi:MFS family permease
MTRQGRPSASSAMFAALAVPNFRRYVSGQALSLIGTWVETVAQALLVLRLTHSGTILGLTTAARYAPILILSPYAGVLVDRYAKRHVLLATQTGLGLVWPCSSARSARWTTQPGRRSFRRWSAETWSGTRSR